MKKAKYLFMKTVKIKGYMKKVENTGKKSTKVVMSKDEHGNEVDAMTAAGVGFFDDSLYESDEPVQEVKKDVKSDTAEIGLFDDSWYEDEDTGKERKIYVRTSDNLDRITVDNEYRVTKKEALTSIEAKTPFIVGKIDGKKLRIDENDIVYKTIPKIKYSEGKRARRVGYLQVSNKLRCRHLKLENNKNILGILDEEYIITKKKGFNQEKIGYIKLRNEDYEIDRYVEVTKSKGAKELIIWLIILGLIFLLSKYRLPENWHFDLKNLRLYKTEEQIQNKESIVTISHVTEAVLNEGSVDLELTSEANGDTDGELVYQIKIKDNESGETVYESELLPAGSSIQSIEIEKDYGSGNHKLDIICKTYRKNKFNYIGTVESDFILKVK